MSFISAITNFWTPNGQL